MSDLSLDLWNRFRSHYKKRHLAQAILLIGSRSSVFKELTEKMMKTLLCEQQGEVFCDFCQSCQLVALQEHPDLLYIGPEKQYGTISIEKIRLLQENIFLSPQLGNTRGIIINPADRMNTAAANALLKILEEPPKSTYFILIAEQLSTIPATIISRCQQWRLPYVEELGYPAEMQGIIDNLVELKDSKISLNNLAAKWSTFDLHELIRALYILHAELIKSFFKIPSQLGPSEHKTKQLAEKLGPPRLFTLLDKIQKISRALQQNISLNQLLCIEDILSGYQRN